MFQAQAAARHMIAQGTAESRCISVRCGASWGCGAAAMPLIARRRAACAILCKQLAAEWAPHSINVNVVAPTFVRTELVAHMLADPEFYKSWWRASRWAASPSRRTWRNAVLFLASSAADFITGQTLYLDGGITATQ